MNESELAVAVDIGTSKICVLAGHKEDNRIKIVGKSVVKSAGLRKGRIIDIEQVCQQVSEAVGMVEEEAGITIDSAVVGVAAGFVRGVNVESSLAFHGSGVIGYDHIYRLVEDAKRIPLPSDWQILHLLLKGYCVDGVDGIRNPVGMTGKDIKLEGFLALVSKSALQNIRRCMEGAGVRVEHFVLQPLASAEAVLDAEEKQLGVALVDIGAGTTDLIIYKDGGVHYTEVLALGGDHISYDIAIGMHTPLYKAEEIKKIVGCSSENVSEERELNIRRAYRERVVDIARLRVEEMMSLVDKAITRSGCRSVLGGGVVLTGGSALLLGIDEVAVRVLGLPVRIGVPAENILINGDDLKDPAFSTAVGLLKYRLGLVDGGMLLHTPRNPLRKLISRVRSIFRE